MTYDFTVFQRLGLIRGLAMLVLLAASLGGAPQGVSAFGECTDYFIGGVCSNEGDCEDDMGEACGEQIQGCAGQGTIICESSLFCDEGETKKICSFGGGGAL